MDDDLSLTTPAAADAPSASSSAPDPTGAAVTAPVDSSTAPAVTGTPTTDPVTGDPNAPAAPAADPDAPPEGTSEVQAGRWKTLSQSRDAWRNKAEASTERIKPIEDVYDDTLAFANVARRFEVGDADARELEQIIYRLNPPLWEQMVRRAHAEYGAQLGANAEAPGASASPAAAPPPPAPGPSAASHEGLEEELAYLRGVNPQLAAYIEQQAEAAARVAEVEARLNSFEQRTQQTETERVEAAHDSQLVPFFGQLFSEHGVTPTITIDGREQPNPQLVRMLEFLEDRVKRDPRADAALRASRRAHASGQRGALPELTAKARAEIGRVFGDEIAPLFAQAHTRALAESEAARAAAAATPPPSPGGATAPAPGQGGRLPLQQRINGYYAQEQRR